VTAASPVSGPFHVEPVQTPNPFHVERNVIHVEHTVIHSLIHVEQIGRRDPR
jgi:hypothetical protein